MCEISIKRKNFTDATNEIKIFSEKADKSISLSQVATKGSFLKVTSHNVKGTEFNKIVSEVQDEFIRSNENIKATIKEFEKIYIALDALDKEYIDAILCNIDCLKKVHEKTYANTLDIKKTIRNQSEILKVLNQFKERVDKFDLINKMDVVLNGCQNDDNSGSHSIYESLLYIRFLDFQKKSRVILWLVVIVTIINIISVIYLWHYCHA